MDELKAFEEQLTQADVDYAKLKSEADKLEEDLNSEADKIRESVKKHATLDDELTNAKDEMFKLMRSKSDMKFKCNRVHDANVKDRLLEETEETRYSDTIEHLKNKIANAKILKRFEQIPISSEEINKEKESGLDLLWKAMNNDDEHDDYLSDICDSLGEEMSL